MLVLFGISLLIYIPTASNSSGFKNGMREEERLQLQKQVDTINKK
jgi:hypothetical protein